MASITEKVKDGKIVSFKFKACVGRDENGKQVFKCMTWYPAADMTKAKSRKEAAAAAAEWEREQKKAFLLEEEERKTQEAEKTEKMKVLSFGRFVREIWFPLAVDDGEHSPSTVAMYKHILNVILPRFGEMPLQEITGLQITAYLNWLRKDYRTAYGLPLADKTVKHHFNILRIAFNYAEKHDLILKNPIRKVDAPKLAKKKVDALTKEDVSKLMAALEKCDFELRCMLQLMLTAGLRRGECLGLQWQDIDFEQVTISIKRAVIYTKETALFRDLRRFWLSLIGASLTPLLRQYLEKRNFIMEKTHTPFH